MAETLPKLMQLKLPRFSQFYKYHQRYTQNDHSLLSCKVEQEFFSDDQEICNPASNSDIIDLNSSFQMPTIKVEEDLSTDLSVRIPAPCKAAQNSSDSYDNCINNNPYKYYNPVTYASTTQLSNPFDQNANPYINEYATNYDVSDNQNMLEVFGFSDFQDSFCAQYLINNPNQYKYYNPDKFKVVENENSNLFVLKNHHIERKPQKWKIDYATLTMKTVLDRGRSSRKKKRKKNKEKQDFDDIESIVERLRIRSERRVQRQLIREEREQNPELMHEYQTKRCERMIRRKQNRLALKFARECNPKLMENFCLHRKVRNELRRERRKLKK